MSNISKLLMLLAIGVVLACSSVYLIGGKKQEFDAEVVIKAPVGQIFPYLSQPQLKKQWMQGLVDQQLTDGDAIAEGAMLQSTLTSNGVSEQFQDEVIRFRENEIVSIKSRNPRLSSTTMLKLKEEGSGTRVSYKRVVQYNGIDRFKTVFSESTFQQELEQDLDKLVKMVEDNVAVPDGSPAVEPADDGDPETASSDSRE